MSYLEDVQTGRFFRAVTAQSVERAASNLGMAIDRILTPYYDLTSNLKAVAHPFYHLTQLVRDVGRFVYGTCVLVGSLFTGHFNTAGMVAFDMLKTVGAALLEVLNIALAVVSLATRFVASVFNLGYVSTSVQLRSASLNGAEVGGRNAETMNNVFSSFVCQAESQTSYLSDEEGHRTAFTLV